MAKEESNSRSVEEDIPPAAAQRPDEDDASSSDDDDEDDLVLEGVIIRNPDVSDSDDTTSEEESDDDGERKPPPTKKQKLEDSKKSGPSTTETKKKQIKQQLPKRNKKKKKKKEAGPEIVQVDFIFCDMSEKFFYGLKTLLTATSPPVYGLHSSGLADLMIENVSVGTVTSTEGDEEGTVFGFASVLNVTTYQDQACIQGLKKLCLEHCPEAHKKELEVVLSGKTKRPAGFYLHGRMVNMPLEIVQVLHEQLVLDMDWAVENAEGGIEQRKSLDFGAFVRLAPSYRSSGVSYYKLFDDEIFGGHAEFTYEIELPKSPGLEETPYCTVMVLTKTGHRAAMKSLAEMVGGATS